MNSTLPIKSSGSETELPVSEFLTTSDELSEVHSQLTRFVRERVDKSGGRGAVVAMSGGIDSTVTAMLAVEALGSDSVLGLGLPYNKLDSYHMKDARTVAEGLGIEFHQLQLQPLVEVFQQVIAPLATTGGDRVSVGNAVARMRMLIAYYASNTRNWRVIGTSNRSELLLGYFTKYGDGGTDQYPLGDLYKTEVRALAHHIGVPHRIIHKTPTAGMWAGQTDESELGASYDELDRFLQRVVEDGMAVEPAARVVGLDVATAERISQRFVKTRHKRTTPPTPSIRDRG